jgi:hypothetical protein
MPFRNMWGKQRLTLARYVLLLTRTRVNNPCCLQGKKGSRNHSYKRNDFEDVIRLLFEGQVPGAFFCRVGARGVFTVLTVTQYRELRREVIQR